MIEIKLTEDQRKNLVTFLTGEGRVHLTGNEAFEFVNIVNVIANAKEEEVEETLFED